MTATWKENRISNIADSPSDGYDTEAYEALVRGSSIEPDTSWSRIDLRPVLAGTHTQPMPTVLQRTDGRSLFYPRAVNGVHGDSGIGKGWLLCRAVVDVVRAGGNVLVLDFEDVEQSFTARLRLLGLSDEQIAGDQIAYHRPQSEFTPTELRRLLADIELRQYELVVIDSLGEVFGLHGINEDKDSEVGPWLRQYARAIAEAGPAVVLIDHATKAADNPLHPSGSKRKRAAIGGASYLVEATTPFVQGDGGRLRVKCAKDRHGNYRRGEVVAHLVMATSISGDMTLGLYPEDTADDSSATVPVVLAAQEVVRIVRDSPEPLHKSAVRALLTIKASTDVKRAAIEYALDKGAVAMSRGIRNAMVLRFVHNLDEQPVATNSLLATTTFACSCNAADCECVAQKHCWHPVLCPGFGEPK